MLQAIEPFIGYADELVGLLAVVRENCDAMIHVDAHAERQGVQDFGKNSLDAAAERQRLVGIGLRQE